MAKKNNKRVLSQGLDNDVLPYVMDYQRSNPEVTETELCSLVKKVPRFGRKTDVLIAQSVARVLDTIKAEKERRPDSDEEGGEGENDSDNEEDPGDDTTSAPSTPVVMMEVKDTNKMNKNYLNLWKKQGTGSGLSTAAGSPSNSEPSTPLLQPDQSPSLAGGQSVTPLAVGPSEATTEVVGQEAAVDGASLSKSSSKRKAKSSGSESTKRAKSSNTTTDVRGGEEFAPPKVRLEDLGGIGQCIEKVKEYIMTPLDHPEVYMHMGVKPPRGILLHGPPGCGKTMLANAIAGSLGVPFITISAPSVVSGMSGESEKKVRDVFEKAKELAPCLMFIDEIDAITPKRETAQREMEKRIVAQLLTCMDDLSWEKTNGKPVMIIGATNRPDSLDPALRRAGRFDVEINVGVPDQDSREEILRVMSSKLRLAGDFDFKELAKLTPGYVGADLNALTSAAGVAALKRIFQEIGDMDAMQELESMEKVTDGIELMDVDQEMTDVTTAAAAPTEIVSSVQSTEAQVLVSAQAVVEDENATTSTTTTSSSAMVRSSPSRPSTKGSDSHHSISAFLRSHPNPLTPEQLEPLYITNADFLVALSKVQPSAKREGFVTVPDVTWDDIGALSFVREELQMAVVEPIKYPHLFRSVGIQSPAGVLLWGPPGCGKTLLAKAVANESRTNFISVKGPELLNKYVGESERGIRQVFARARASAPCVIFFDELDALCSRRDDSQSEAGARVVNTLLTELDGMENRAAVYVIAATNRPDMIDPAMLRPGRLDKLLYVELPSPEERLEILKTLSKRTPLGPDVKMEVVAMDERCAQFSGADLASLVREAAVSALRSTLRIRNAMGKAGELLTEQEEKGVKADGSPADEPLIFVTLQDFETAFSKVSPSVSTQDKKKYDNLRVKFGCATPTSLKEDQEEKERRKEAKAKKAAAAVANGTDAAAKPVA